MLKAALIITENGLVLWNAEMRHHLNGIISCNVFWTSPVPAIISVILHWCEECFNVIQDIRFRLPTNSFFFIACTKQYFTTKIRDMECMPSTLYSMMGNVDIFCQYLQDNKWQSLTDLIYIKLVSHHQNRQWLTMQIFIFLAVTLVSLQNK